MIKCKCKCKWLYDAIQDLKRERKKKLGQMWDQTAGRSRQRDMTCNLPSVPLELMTLQALLCFLWFFLYLDWQMSRPIRGVIYSQTNGAVSNYTYLFRFVWIVVVFSDLLFCFRICHCVFWIVILFFIFAFAFVICYFVFKIVFCFALVGHRTYYFAMQFLPSSFC